MSYPEHDKLELISGKSQAIYDFLEWLMGEKGLSLGEWVEVESLTGRKLQNRNGEPIMRFMPAARDKRKLLAEFFELDLNKIEDEKRAMLDEMRKAQSA